jgi:hypothetical protein
MDQTQQQHQQMHEDPMVNAGQYYTFDPDTGNAPYTMGYQPDMASYGAVMHPGVPRAFSGLC